MKKIITLTLLFLCSHLIIAEGERKTECPPPELTPSCTCEFKTILKNCKFLFWDCTKVHQVILSCYNATNVWDFFNIFQNLQHYNIYELYYHNLYMQFIPKGFLKYLPINSLNISNSVILGLETEDGEDMFEGAIDTINKFHIYNVEGAKSWRWKALSSLKKLEEVTVINCDLTEITQDFNPPSKSIHSISFSGNKIARIDNNTLSRYHRITTLDLSKNELSIIKRHMFPNPAENLTVLSLGNNKIMELPSGIFSNMPKLIILFLEFNRIKWLSLTAFESLIHKQRFILLEGNNLLCCSAQMWIIDSSFQNSLKGICAAPAILAGKLIPNLTASDLRHGLC